MALDDARHVHGASLPRPARLKATRPPPMGRRGSDGTPPTSPRRPVTAIRADGLTKAFGEHRAVDGLTLIVEPGEVLALLGPNGAGKTTTVRLLNGVLAPDAGWPQVLGLDPAVDGDEVRRRTGVLTENAGLDDRLTTRENLVFTARIRGMARPTRPSSRVDELLEQFGMAERPTTSPRASRPASASGWPWPARCCTTPRCSSSTSRPRASTRPAPATSSTSSSRWPSEGRTIVLPPTSSARPAAWPTAWRCCTAADLAGLRPPRRAGRRALARASTPTSTSAARPPPDRSPPLGRRARGHRGGARPTAPGCGWWSTTARCCPELVGRPRSTGACAVYGVDVAAAQPRGRLLRHRGPHPGRARRPPPPTAPRSAAGPSA